MQEKLKDILLPDREELLKFLEGSIDLGTIPFSSSTILNTHNIFNVEILDHGTKLIVFNLHNINDIRRINKYFIKVNLLNDQNGWFIGCAKTIHTSYNQIFENYPKLLANIFYPFIFLIKRVFPKLPLTKQIYFLFTRGYNRSISMSEIIGRLYFCGYEVIATTDVEDKFYYIARKIKSPSNDQSPSYGPLIRLKRIGKNGKTFNLFKFRTMHPYSEYAQEYLYKLNDLEESGKIKDDFRITTWGKWFRRLWIDELPQFINVIRGDISLIGVRALSEHYFSLYPSDLRELRTKVKPGLIPPYYVDLPKNFEEIVDSERRYLESYLEKPVRTFLRYGFLAVWNIIVRGARSG